MSTGRVCVAILAAWLLCGSGCSKGDVPGAGSGSGAAAAAVTPSTGNSEKMHSDAAGGDGVFRGRVLLDGPAPGRQKLMVVKDVAVCGRIDHLDDRLVVGEAGGIRYAVVSVRGEHIGKGNGKGTAAQGTEFVLDQRTCSYSPHVLLLPKGGKLKVLNNDGILHNIHTFSALNKPFNIAQPKVLREIERTFAVPERIQVKCDVHGWMSSWVIVVDDAYNAVTDGEGRFEISGIPPGRYTVTCWQEELGEQSTEITVPPAGGGAGIVAHDFVYSRETPQARAN